MQHSVAIPGGVEEPDLRRRVHGGHVAGHSFAFEHSCIRKLDLLQLHVEVPVRLGKDWEASWAPRNIPVRGTDLGVWRCSEVGSLAEEPRVYRWTYRA